MAAFRSGTPALPQSTNVGAAFRAGTVESPKQGHKILQNASVWLSGDDKLGKRLAEQKNMYTTKGGSLTSRSISNMSEPARKLVVSSGSFTARELRRSADPRASEEDKTALLQQQRPLNAAERDLMRLLEQLALKASQRFHNVSEVFRGLDADHDGWIDRAEVRYFFRTHGYGEHVADAFWDHLDSRGTEFKLNYKQFVSFLRPFLDAAFQGKSWADENKVTMAPRVDDRLLSEKPGNTEKIQAVQREFAETLEFMGKKARFKWSNMRFAFRFVNREKMGMVTISEMHAFFRAFNVEDHIAEAFHKSLDFYGNGDVLLEDFEMCMAPYLKPDVVPREPAKLTALIESTSDATPTTHTDMVATFQGTWNPGSTMTISRQLDPALLQELRSTMQEIGLKIEMSFKNPRDAFRSLDLQRDGHITRKEMRYFFRGFNKTDEFADKIFDLLDPSDTGSVDFADFLSHFDSVLNPAHRQTHRAAIIPVDNLEFSLQVTDVVNAIGTRLTTKYKTVQDAFRDLDLNRDQKASKEEIQIWTKKMGLPEASANAFHEAFHTHWDATGCIPKRAFVAFFRDLRGETAKSEIMSKLPR